MLPRCTQGCIPGRVYQGCIPGRVYQGGIPTGCTRVGIPTGCTTGCIALPWVYHRVYSSPRGVPGGVLPLFLTCFCSFSRCFCSLFPLFLLHFCTVLVNNVPGIGPGTGFLTLGYSLGCLRFIRCFSESGTILTRFIRNVRFRRLGMGCGTVCRGVIGSAERCKRCKTGRNRAQT